MRKGGLDRAVILFDTYEQAGYNNNLKITLKNI
jgi:hypothetical protein